MTEQLSTPNIATKIPNQVAADSGLILDPTLSVQTRTEHSRSIEDAERYRALDTLTELGLLVPLANLETYHGRARVADEAQWAVKPDFKNGSNDSGNSNVNSRPTLYTGELSTATEFSTERKREKTWARSRDKLAEEMKAENPEDVRNRQVELYRQKNEALPEEQRKHMITPEQYRERNFSGMGPLSEVELNKAARTELEYNTERAVQVWKRAADEVEPEIAKVVSEDTDARVIDLSFDFSKLDDDDKQRVHGALKDIVINVTEGSPVAFDERARIQAVAKSLGKSQLADEEKIANAADETGASSELVVQIASALNARTLALSSPGYLAEKLVKSGDDWTISQVTVDGEKKEIPINLEWVQRYFRANHIVGVSQSINSATLGRDITSVSLFDLEKVNSESALEAAKVKTANVLGALASKFNVEAPALHEDWPDVLKKALGDPHSKPSTLVDAAMEIEGFKEVFEADAGNWEGFTLAEHTETVLRNFDENYADRVPVSMVGPIRLALLAHDLGKPEAVRDGNKQLEPEYNQRFADRFFKAIGYDEKSAALLMSMIGDGVKLFEQIAIRDGGQSKIDELKELARQSLGKFTGEPGEIPDALIDGYMAVCKMIFVCDGGAYTSMAITRRKGVGTYRNAPSFNRTFAQPLGFGRRGLRIANQGEQTASDSHFEVDDKPRSRVRISPNKANIASRPPVI